MDRVILKQHNDRLQSLRGIAAFNVLIGHSLLIFDQGYAMTWLNTVFQPGAAVVFFYVLSGFVLGESLRRLQVESATVFVRFAIKRLCRLLPVLWVSVLVGALVGNIMFGAPFAGVSSWFRHFLAIDASFADIIASLTANRTVTNGVLWSVQVELIMIPILPVMVFVNRRGTLALDLAILAALCLVMLLYLRSVTMEHPDLRFLAYLDTFYLGVMLPKLMAMPGLRGFLTNGAAVCIEIVIYFLGFRASQYFNDISVGTLYVFDAFVSAHIIAFVILSPQSSQFLQARPLVWLGDVSYSFYAYGNVFLVLCACAVMLMLPAEWRFTRFGSFAILAITLIVTLSIVLPVSWASLKWVERPSIMLGRRLAADPKWRSAGRMQPE